MAVIPFKHVQLIVGPRMKLGATSEEFDIVVPGTDIEVFRTLVDPGFSGDILFFLGDFDFKALHTSGTNVTHTWQGRTLGKTTWVDLQGPETIFWTSPASTIERTVILEAAALTSNADTTPLEIRLIVTLAAGTARVTLGDAGVIPIVDIAGNTI